jgi:short subunit dehydrogenase-like uncharacterized protein
LRWAIAGRNRSKLDTANSAGVDVLVADAQDDDALSRMAAQTRVVATTTGPFSLYGTKLVDACVCNRTHYCDITGETPWVRRLIDRHHAQASTDGTRIVTSCGFDSIPSDYGSWLTFRHIRDALQSDCASVSAYFRVGGGINGGTLASFFYMIESGEIVIARDPFLLDPDPAAHTAEERARNADPAGSHYDAELQSWVAPFVMGMINTRVVRRTQALLGEQFDYQEYAKFKKSSTARMVTMGSKIFESIAGSGVGRQILKPLLPQPGDGPSEKDDEQRLLRMRVHRHCKERRARPRNLQRAGRCGKPDHSQMPLRVSLRPGAVIHCSKWRESGRRSDTRDRVGRHTGCPLGHRWDPFRARLAGLVMAPL